ncbi:hypothetical protein ILFOPFJJ_05446 [Ensifer psoraleae]|uniref:phosphotransferase family protein n=1 Tax=Sinorhizobium psoraleae TaxID=520838 RepID=UPI001569165E|nr:aminoglycoside phosphotransferase family protein [Sinorhizobium psoraleae]NRP74524.1 hypothetical protein [Sinorhizobium psoraleae]
MRDVEDLRNAERTLAKVLGQGELHLELVLNGVNKTLAGHCEQGDFYLRLSPEGLHSSLELKREAMILKCIAGHDPSIAAKPFMGPKHAGTAFVWDGERYYGIATTVAAGDPYDDSAGRLRQFGRALGKLHAIPVTEKFERVERATHLTATAKLAEEISLVQRAAAQWADRGEPTSSGKTSIRHGDAWPGNGRFSGSKVTLFDFEHTSVGDPVADVANVAWWLTGLQQPSALKSELWSAFLEGYDEIQDGERADLSSLPYHVLSVELRSLIFLRDFIKLSPEVEKCVLAGTHHLVGVWRDRAVPESGFLKDGW